MMQIEAKGEPKATENGEKGGAPGESDRLRLEALEAQAGVEVPGGQGQILCGGRGSLEKG